MVNTKTLIIGALFAIMAALFQALPVMLSEVFVLFTIFSGIPIYIVARISPRAGVLSYLVAAMLIIIISTHEGLFFLCTNGIIGCSLESLVTIQIRKLLFGFVVLLPLQCR